MHRLQKIALANFKPRFLELYGEDKTERLLERLYTVLGRYDNEPSPTLLHSRREPWTQQDVVLITYGDMVRNSTESPLKTLHQFALKYCHGIIDTIHILPFFPYSSDDGFSIVDYRQVNPDLGTWKEIERIATDFKLMFDLVLNHVSRRSEWFRDYTAGIMPARQFFLEVSEHADLSQVVRPRNTPLLTRTHTRDGTRFVWSTFSDDQIDLDFANPDVLFEFIDIMLLYIEKGARIIRLDAIAYLWKKIGTACIHLPQTHTVVKLLRDIIDLLPVNALIMTETNVPHPQNISYFGDGDEAHMVYQFSLPPLLLHALLNGTAKHLREWATALAEPPPGCTYFNFTASHDGIGVRPLEGMVPDAEIKALCQAVEKRGGYVSTKTNTDGSKSPYELNITYFDALRGAKAEDSQRHADRFLCSQAIALSLKGIPGIYFNSLFGAENDRPQAEETGIPRAINRQKWALESLEAMLQNDTESGKSRIFQRYMAMLKTRRRNTAFHPDASQKILPVQGDAIFALVRQSPDSQHKIWVLANVTSEPQTVDLAAEQMPELHQPPPKLHDLISGQQPQITRGKLKLQPYQTAWITLKTDR